MFICGFSASSKRDDLRLRGSGAITGDSMKFAGGGAIQWIEGNARRTEGIFRVAAGIEEMGCVMMQPAGNCVQVFDAVDE